MIKGALSGGLFMLHGGAPFDVLYHLTTSHAILIIRYLTKTKDYFILHCGKYNCKLIGMDFFYHKNTMTREINWFYMYKISYLNNLY